MDLLAMAQRVKRESGRAGTSLASVATAAGEDLDIVNWVIEAWNEVQQLPYNWAWMRNSAVLGDLVIDTHAHPPLSLNAPNCGYFMPASEEYAPTVYDTTNAATEWELTFLEYNRFRSMFLVGVHDSAAPQYWSIAPNGDFLVGPKPILSTYKLRFDFFSAPIVLADDTDEPAMPSQFHMLPVWKAVQQAGAFDGAADVYARAGAEADKLLDRLIDSQGEKIRFASRPLA